jgi:hypothetical protein
LLAAEVDTGEHRDVAIAQTGVVGEFAKGCGSLMVGVNEESGAQEVGHRGSESVGDPVEGLAGGPLIALTILEAREIALGYSRPVSQRGERDPKLAASLPYALADRRASRADLERSLWLPRWKRAISNRQRVRRWPPRESFARSLSQIDESLECSVGERDIVVGPWRAEPAEQPEMCRHRVIVDVLDLDTRISSVELSKLVDMLD